MRVLHVTRDLPPEGRGGISTVVAGMIRALAQTGVEVGVVSFDDWRPRRGRDGRAGEETLGGESPRGGPADVPASVFRVRTADAIAGALGFATAFRPTLLHVHHGMLWDFAEAVRARVAVPVVKTIHVLQAEAHRLRHSREPTMSLVGQERALRCADRVLAPSPSAAAALERDYPAMTPRLRIVPHGIEDSAAAREAVARRCRGDDVRCGPVLSIGRFADLKGTEDLFRFLSQLLIAAPEVSCVVVGGVPHDARADARWRRRWCGREMAGASGRVVFTGWLPQAAALAHYATASVLVVPSRVETFGLVALEGMLYGIPVVATASGGLADMIRDGGTGVLVPSGDVGRLVWAVRELLANSQRARRLGMAAAVDVRRTWLWPLVIPRLLGVYRELA